MKKAYLVLIPLLYLSLTYSQEIQTIPQIHSNLSYDSTGTLIFTTKDGLVLPSIPYSDNYSLSKLRIIPAANDTGLVFNFKDPDFGGWISYGLIQTIGSKYQYPLFYGSEVEIDSGIAVINIEKSLKGLFDITGWEESKLIRLGYRIANESGEILYDGKILVSADSSYEVEPSIIEGPFINLLTPEGATISFETSTPIICQVSVGNLIFKETIPNTHHEIDITNLNDDSDYVYTIHYGKYSDSYSFHTAPSPGTRKPFTFGYASDCRGNSGGGERDIKGTNAYIMKRIAALSAFKNARFFQSTGDMIDGNNTDIESINLEYANWKRAIEPFASYVPYITGFGNHEAYWKIFAKDDKYAIIDNFPFGDNSSESLYAENFVNPINGPFSEDGAIYDPDTSKIDFPPYTENVFYYTYDNIGVIVLNSHYWFAPTVGRTPEHSGNLQGYFLDNQLKWLKSTLKHFEKNKDIDHIFVTHHSPVFSNSGHIYNSMWWLGDNSKRPYIAGKPLEKGIIEKRDEYLDILMNYSSKVIAVLMSDDHNFNRMKLTSDTPIYPDDYDKPKLNKYRPITFITNGAAGAPYYGQMDVPWTDHVDKFIAQYAVLFIHVDGKKVWCEVFNPDTLEILDTFTLTG